MCCVDIIVPEAIHNSVHVDIKPLVSGLLT